MEQANIKQQFLTWRYRNIMAAKPLLRVCVTMQAALFPLYTLDRGFSPAVAGLTTATFMLVALLYGENHAHADCSNRAFAYGTGRASECLQHKKHAVLKYERTGKLYRETYTSTAPRLKPGAWLSRHRRSRSARDGCYPDLSDRTAGRLTAARHWVKAQCRVVAEVIRR